ncbi:phosphatase PAP2 family protein [Shewanella intestini]|uniref:undecaprenyl-diphosphate phosphatase n=1 Tax=Shewanella intestini TaxID=2017544 RepID=A0ABS5I2B2_9GAMM|nr:MULTISPECIES: phosphatase PAP2 family protein [Shewanella]MBR9727540.1 phosphatase PAP2 family protein [Shewanella intestini]MRG35310.1 phosphatase PAP2 family protein [Shewanella sp. XMDDZSB0408]
MRVAITKMDKTAFYYLASLGRVAKWHTLALRTSACGNGPLYVVLFVGLFFTHQQGSAFFHAGLISFAIELPIYFGLKNGIRRVRPCHCLAGVQSSIEPSDKFSLPSGHSSAAFVMAGLVYCFFPLFAPIAFIWATAIALSRVILGVHYPLDTIAGMGLGIGSVWCASLFFIGV